MFSFNAGDKIQGNATNANQVDYVIYGQQSSGVLKQLADGQLPAILGDLYTAATIDVVTSIIFTNTGVSANYINLYYLSLAGGITRSLIPVNLRLDPGCSLYFDGVKAMVLNMSGAIVESGSAGAPGSVWYQGSGIPSEDMGTLNDYYLDVDNGDVYQKSDSSPTWSLVGNIKGLQGDIGVPGSVWYYGSGVPSEGVGIDGDYYLNVDNGDVYQKSGSPVSWSVVGNIKGLQGDSGDEVELQVSDGYIQWRYVGGFWNDLIAVSSLKGDTGASGSVWYEGSDVPAEEIGIDGDYYLDVDNGDVYQKQGSPAVWTLIGNIKGIKGDTGLAGSVWWNDSGAPVSSPDFGVLNNYYLDTVNGDVYEKQGSPATWILIGNIKGEKGDTGATGGIPNVIATGTSDAIIATYSPPIVLDDLIIVAFRATAPNATTTPSFTPNGLATDPITKNGGQILDIGDIPAADAVCIVQYNASSPAYWDLLNPTVSDIAFASAAEILTGTEAAKAIAPDQFVSSNVRKLLTAAGDILYASAANTLARLAKATDGQVLTLASGLPSWANVAVADGSITEAKMAASAISQAKLKTSYGSVSDIGFNNITLPGGVYGFYPQIKFISGNGGTMSPTLGINYTSASYTTNVCLAVTAGTGYAQQYYISASSEDHWIFLLIDKLTRKIIAAYEAPDHPSANSQALHTELPHPFGSYDSAKHDIVLADNEIFNSIKTHMNRRRGILDIINEACIVDDAKSAEYDPRVIRKINEWIDDPYPGSFKTEAIRVPQWAKIMIRPDVIALEDFAVEKLPDFINYRHLYFDDMKLK